MKDLKISINDLPEIVILNQEIQRFRKMMFMNSAHEEEETYRSAADRHFLNGLQRARDLLVLMHYQGTA